MSVNLLIAVMFFLLQYFYTDIFGLKPAHVGILFLVARFVDAFSDPLMGLITDKFKSRYGRFRQYFLFLSVPYGFAIFLLFTTPDEIGRASCREIECGSAQYVIVLN